MNPREVVLCNPVRTAIGTYGGSLKDIPAPDLGAAVIRETLKRSGLAADKVQALIMGNVIQAATGATFGKLLISKTFYGKLAATFYHPQKGGIRFSLKPDAVDGMGKFEFIAMRKKGIEPSQIPAPVSEEIIRWVYEQTDETLFSVEPKPDFQFKPVKGSFNKTKCGICGEYVFDRYLRMKDGKPVCIPCSGY